MAVHCRLRKNIQQEFIFVPSCFLSPLHFDFEHLDMQVNEIYRDLANIVEHQSEAVEQIEANTEGAHARAHEGLVQVRFACSLRAAVQW